MAGTVTMDAGGSTDPGPAYNFDSDNGIALLMRFKECAKSGDFRVKQSTDGISISTSGDILTNRLVTDPGGFLNDGSSPATARFDGSLANCGAGFVLAPEAPYEQWEAYIEVVSGAVSGVYLRVQIATHGFGNITVAGRAPEPTLVGDALTRLGSGTNVAPVGVLALGTGGRLDCTVTSGGDRPFIDATVHTRGTDALTFSFVADFLQSTTLNDEGVTDPYPWVVGAFGAAMQFGSLAMATPLGSEAPGAAGFVTRFDDNLSVIVTAHPLLMPDGSGGYSHCRTLGKDTLNQKESGIPLIFCRANILPIGRGSGLKGVSGHLKWTSDAHVFGEHGNEADPESREDYVVGDVRMKWGKPSVECLR